MTLTKDKPRRGTYTYGIFCGNRWAMETSLVRARQIAKENGGEIRRMNYIPEVSSWDAPTFFACSRHLETWTKGG